MRDLENTPFLFSEWFTRHQSVFTRDFPMYKIITIDKYAAICQYILFHIVCNKDFPHLSITLDHILLGG